MHPAVMIYWSQFPIISPDFAQQREKIREMIDSGELQLPGVNA